MPRTERRDRQQVDAMCIRCGCTDSVACLEGCWWIAVDRQRHIGICSKLWRSENRAGGAREEVSLGTRIPFGRAFGLAREISAELAPVVARSKVAGSLRRKRPHVSDIEIVAEPLHAGDLFGQQKPEVDNVRRLLASLGELVKAGDRYIQVVHVLGVQDLKLDLFLVHPPAQWGSILAIRTGPAELGELAVTRMRTFGYRHDGGHVEIAATGELVPTPEEADFFRCAGLPCLPPAQRDTAAARRPIGVPA